MKDLNGEFVQEGHVLYDDKEHRRVRKLYRKLKQKRFRKNCRSFIDDEVSQYFSNEGILDDKESDEDLWSRK